MYKLLSKCREECFSQNILYYTFTSFANTKQTTKNGRQFMKFSMLCRESCINCEVNAEKSVFLKIYYTKLGLINLFEFCGSGRYDFPTNNTLLRAKTTKTLFRLCPPKPHNHIHVMLHGTLQ